MRHKSKSEAQNDTNSTQVEVTKISASHDLHFSFARCLIQEQQAMRKVSLSPFLPWLYHIHPHPSLTLSLTLHPLRLAFVIRVITIRFLSIRTCSSYLPHAPCSCCLSPCFMHARILPHLCAEICVCVSVWVCMCKSSLLMPRLTLCFMHCVVQGKTSECMSVSSVCVCVYTA